MNGLQIVYRNLVIVMIVVSLAAIYMISRNNVYGIVNETWRGVSSATEGSRRTQHEKAEEETFTSSKQENNYAVTTDVNEEFFESSLYPESRAIISTPVMTTNTIESIESSYFPIEASHGKYADTLPPEVREAMNDRFLFPVIHFDGSAGFQYRQLKTAVQMAVYTNRSIVLAPFSYYRNSTMTISFSKTFNVTVFRQFIPAISIEEYRKKCGSVMNSVLVIPVVREYILESFDRQRNWLREEAGITIPKQFTTMGRTLSVTSWSQRDNSTNARCVVMLMPIQFGNLRFPRNDQVRDGLNRHLVWISIVKKTVEDILPKLCDGKPVLAVHWRNKTGETCRYRPKEPSCKNLYELQKFVIKRLAKHIFNVMERYDISCVYIAHAPKEEKNIYSLLPDRLLSKLISMKDILSLHNPYIDLLNGDNYMFSLIELELCAQVKAFIGIGKSNWSNTIFDERRAFGREGNYDMTEDFPDLNEKGAAWFRK